MPYYHARVRGDPLRGEIYFVYWSASAFSILRSLLRFVVYYERIYGRIYYDTTSASVRAKFYKKKIKKMHTLVNGGNSTSPLFNLSYTKQSYLQRSVLFEAQLQVTQTSITALCIFKYTYNRKPISYL
jgi:hypothetical protein